MQITFDVTWQEAEQLMRCYNQIKNSHNAVRADYSVDLNMSVFMNEFERACRFALMPESGNSLRLVMRRALVRFAEENGVQLNDENIRAELIRIANGKKAREVGDVRRNQLRKVLEYMHIDWKVERPAD